MVSLSLINHASVLIETGDVRLLTDPWYLGPAFHDGWDLVTSGGLGAADFANITHLWFSHEHPDHFSPATLKLIPPEVRPNIQVLFQATRDRKVLTFCAKMGFATRELPSGRWVQLADQFDVMCEAVPFYDSWLMVSAQGVRILNLNDCELDRPGNLSRVQRRIGGPVDVLLTQFSYAGWNGPAEAKHERERAAQAVLDRMVFQVLAIQPKFVVPFASFVHFSHSENAYLNDSMNSPTAAVEVMSTATTAQPVVLYAGEQWQVGEAHDNGPALNRWQADFESVRSRPLREGRPVEMERLLRLSEAYIARVRTKNSMWLVRALRMFGFFPQVRITLSDLATRVIFDAILGLRLSDEQAARREPDVTISSASLAFLLEYEWGIDTLNVNGRLVGTREGFSRVIRSFALGALNNTGRRLQLSLLLDIEFCLRALDRLFPWISVRGFVPAARNF